MANITVLKISYKHMEYIELDKEYKYTDVCKLLGNKILSASVRYLDMFRFRVYSEDHVTEPLFVAAFNKDGTPDIINDAILVLEDDIEDQYGMNESLSINEVVKSFIEKHTGYSVLKNKEEQPCIQW